MDTFPIAVVTAGGPHVWAIVNALQDRFGPVAVILEQPESKRRLLQRRAKKLGWISVAGQLGTMVFTRLRKKVLGSRDLDAIAGEGLDTTQRPGQTIICRLVGAGVLAQIPCPVLNYHAGITPKYRGMNGGYWSLATGDAENFGAKVHLVDAGVDTGGVLRQVRGAPKQGDNLTNYALRLAAMSRDICIRAVEDALAGKLSPIDPRLPSKQWYHPTIWFYLWTGLTKGVW